MTQTHLFTGEGLPPRDSEAWYGVSRTASDDEINAKYVAGDARIVTEQARYPLNAIPAMLASGQYELRPDFQRRHRWSNAKKSRLIESFIMNVPIPPVFLYEDTFSHYEVMDGLQRLTSIDSFYRDQFALEGLEEWAELNGRKYSNLPEQIRKGVDRRYLSSVVLLQETAKEAKEAERLKQLVFERINSGGVKLEPQETRNAIFPGRLNDLCITLSRNPDLCLTWGIPLPAHGEGRNNASEELLENELYRTMGDAELVLRFFAYRQRLVHHRGPLKDYLDFFQKYGNNFSDQLLKRYRETFEATINLAADLLGERAFWLWRKRATNWSWLSRPTTVVYDPMMFVLSQMLDSGAHLRRCKAEINAKITGFYEKNYKEFEGRYTNLSNIEKRNTLFSEFFAQF